MGYRLHATIPNVEHEYNDLELGKQYNPVWDLFNESWGFSDEDESLFDASINWVPDQLREFFEALKKINDLLSEDEQLYNIELLEELIEFAIENKYVIWFYSI